MTWYERFGLGLLAAYAGKGFYYMHFHNRRKR